MSKHQSKFLSLVLRHDPARIGIVLDGAGWTDVAALLAACTAHGVAITRAELDEVVATSDKQRFALSPDGARIRANQGHSVEVELDLPRVDPPELLYHGTVDGSLASIREQGLVRGARHHVHLSADVETASKVGGRRGKPVILVVRAREMAAAGHAFYRSANGVWLVDAVPPGCFSVGDAPTEGERPARTAIARATVAACDAGFYANARGERVELADAIAAAAGGTVLHELDLVAAVRAELPPPRATKLSVTDETTIAALARLSAIGPVGCLNFASAKNPGGGFLGGSQAQEESLARSSALYACLLRQPAHYARNRANRSAIYLDLAIFSPGVPFIRDDAGAWRDRPFVASVITCAAPNAGALRQQGVFDAATVDDALRRRVELVLAVAVNHEISRLVLGAWGAGVFGNDPVRVADAFAFHLRTYTFEEVVFAIPNDRDGANLRAFREAFEPRV